MSSNNGLQPAGFETLAPELCVQIMKNLSVTDVTSLLSASKRMREVFHSDQPSVMAAILKEQPGFEEMLFLQTAQRCENHRDRMLHPRVVNVLHDGPAGPSTINLMGQGVVVFQYLSDDPLVWRSNIFNLSMEELLKVWEKVKIIDRYVDLFPRVYWRENPESRRLLRPAEEARLRRAISRWWLYAHHNHGGFHSWRSFQVPRMWDRDPRLVHLRRLDTDEILELQDLWAFVRDVVSNDLCSSPERICRCEDGYVVDLVPWGAEDGRHDTIVSTYMKLTPDQLMYYLDRYSNWNKNVTVNAITADRRLFTRDTETLTISIRKVLEERVLLRDAIQAAFPTCSIVDDTRDHPAFVDAWINDAWPDGRLPLDSDEIRQLNLPEDNGEHSRRGDDGTDASLPF